MLQLRALTERPEVPALPEGITLLDMPALHARDGKDTFDDRLLELIFNVVGDIPGVDASRLDRERESNLAHIYRKGTLPEAYLLAIDGERYVGLSNLREHPEPETVEVGLTGVLRAYRGKGIARALKALGLQRAWDSGMRKVTTGNDVENAPIIAVNLKMGFEITARWVTYAKIIRQ